MSFFFSLFSRFFLILAKISTLVWLYVCPCSTECTWKWTGIWLTCVCVYNVLFGNISLPVLTMFWSAVFYFVGPLRFQTGSITRWDVYQIKVSNTFVVAVVVIRIDKPRVNFPTIDLVVHGYLLRWKVSLGRRGGNNNIGSRRVIWFSSNRSSFLLYNSQILWALLLGCPLIFIVSYSSFCRC